MQTAFCLWPREVLHAACCCQLSGGALTWQARHRRRFVLCDEGHGGRGDPRHQLQPVAVAEQQLACGAARQGRQVGHHEEWQ